VSQFRGALQGKSTGTSQARRNAGFAGFRCEEFPTFEGFPICVRSLANSLLVSGLSLTPYASIGCSPHMHAVNILMMIEITRQRFAYLRCVGVSTALRSHVVTRKSKPDKKTI
jgi:hypothetical protein